MRVLVLIAIALATVGGCSSIRSGLEIDPGATFVLGGDQRGAFRIEALNTGDAAVQIYEVTTSEDTVAVTSLAPGVSALARFQTGSAALIVNASSLPASLDVRITGDTNLGMGYVEVE